MTDAIELRGLRAYGYHGVLADERRDGQEFVVDVTLGVDIDRAARTDDLQATVDYAAVAALVHGIVTGEPVNLIETLAVRIAEAVLDVPLVHSTTVTVHKPAAPIDLPFDDVAVTVRRVGT